MPVADVTTDPENLTMTVVADLAAPVERVWSVYSDPRQLERLWGPPGWPAPFPAFDPTVGGRAVYTMNGPRGEQSSPSGPPVASATKGEAAMKAAYSGMMLSTSLTSEVCPGRPYIRSKLIEFMPRRRKADTDFSISASGWIRPMAS